MNYRIYIRNTSLIVLASVISFSSCRREPVLAPGTEQVCFDEQVMPIIQSYCTMSDCHGSGGESLQLLSYDDVKAIIKPGYPNKSKLYNVITAKGLVLTSMPPKSKTQLTTQQINLITIWILQGAEHTTCVPANCDSVNVTYSSTIAPVIENYCTGCHSGGNPGGGIVLQDYTTVAAAVASGRLSGSIKQLPGYSSMPKNGNKLSDCTIAQITKWINDGTPNN